MWRVILLAIAAVMLPGCWPGHCGGAIRGVSSDTTTDTFFTSSWLFVNVDTGEKDPAVMLANSGFSTSTVIFEGPQGQVPIDLTAQIASSAHSCASAGSVRIKPLAAVAPGDYTLVLLLDGIRFPSLVDVGTWQGKRAIVRHYHAVPMPPPPP